MQAEREIVFDTETTGLDARANRIIELGAIELIDRLPTGRQFHTYLDPGRDFDPLDTKVTEITGLTYAQVAADGHVFAARIDEFLDFIADAPLIAHNADFDMGFLNAEMERDGRDPFPKKRFTDTLRLARAQFPGSPASLDALCRRFDISLARRDTHGAIVDSELLADVYLALRGGRERKLGLDVEPAHALMVGKMGSAKRRPAPLPKIVTATELDAHRAFVAEGGDDMIWARYS